MLTSRFTASLVVSIRRTNLTRFPLFFPEKRPLFLEGDDIFSFGLGLSQDVIPYFTRRIGLIDGQESADPRRWQDQRPDKPADGAHHVAGQEETAHLWLSDIRSLCYGRSTRNARRYDGE